MSAGMNEMQPGASNDASMDCRQFQSIIEGEREGDLSAAEARAFETHLDGCASCLAAVARAEHDLERLAAVLAPPTLPATAWASVDAAIGAALRPASESAPAQSAPAPAPVAAPAPTPATPLAAPRLARGEMTPLVLPVLGLSPDRTPSSVIPIAPAQPLRRTTA